MDGTTPAGAALAPLKGVRAAPVLGPLRAAALLLVGACSDPLPVRDPAAPPPEHPNVVLYLVDTLRADALSCYDPGREGGPTTPALDAFAASGVLFEEAYAPSAWTRASVASLLSSQDPHVHGAEDRYDLLSGAVARLPQVFGEQGYATACITTNRNVGALFGFAAGWDDFIELYEPSSEPGVSATEHVTTADQVTRRALSWISEAPEPFLLLVHSIDPHSPYTPPARFDRWRGGYDGPVDGSQRSLHRRGLTVDDKARVRTLYRGEVAFGDAEFGRLVDALDEGGYGPHTVLAFTADHGEEFWEHDLRGHGRTLHEAAIRVPLLFRAPGLAAGTRREDPASLVDVLPTLLVLCGLPEPEGLEGRALFADGERDGAVFSTLRLEGRRQDVVRRGRFKLLVDEVAGTARLFDLSSGRAEEHDVSDRHPEVARALTDLLARHRERAVVRRAELHGEAGPERMAPEDLPEDARADLERMGYLGDDE